MQEGCRIQRIPCVCLQTWTWLQGERGQSRHVAATATQQVNPVGRIPTVTLPIEVLVTETKTYESLWHLLWHT